MRNKTIGILGGMGPQASVKLYDLIIQKCVKKNPELSSTDFPEILIDSIPVPDFISDSKRFGETREVLQSRVRKMDRFGVDIICIACNTAHIFLPDLVDLTKGKFISIVTEVKNECDKEGFKRIGLFASPNSIRLKLYEVLEKDKILITPNKKIVEKLDEFIRLTINGNVSTQEKKEFNNLCLNFFVENNLDVLILGCTELPLIFKKSKGIIVIDTIDLLATKLVDNINLN
ncbi:MAG: amino acid racemase [bacterium]